MPSPAAALAAALLPVLFAAPAAAQTVLRTDDAGFEISPAGSLAAISRGGKNHLAPNQPAPLRQLRVSGKDLQPESAAWDATAGRLTLLYPGGINAVV